MAEKLYTMAEAEKILEPRLDQLKKAQERLREKWEEGVDCDCCGRLVKLYPYSLNKNACTSLIWIYRLGKNADGGWVHVQGEFKNVYNASATAMSYIILKHWGFIVAKPGNDDPSKNASGYWAITERGKRFMRGEISVSQKAMVYKDSVREWRGKPVKIVDALQDDFHYRELMGEYMNEVDRNLKLAI